MTVWSEMAALVPVQRPRPLSWSATLTQALSSQTQRPDALTVCVCPALLSKQHSDFL